MKYYRIKDGYISSEIAFEEEGCIILPDEYIDNDIVRDSSYHVLDDGTIELSEKYLCRRNLNETDWKVTRHRDQLALGEDTSLTPEEYLDLLTKPKQWRETGSD